MTNQTTEPMDFIVLNIGQAKTSHHWENRDISSPFVRIFHVRKGRAILHLPGKEVAVSEGHMYLVPSYMAHSYECEPGFDFHYLFVFQLSERGMTVFDTYEFPLEVEANEGARLLFDHYCALYPQLQLPTQSADHFEAHPRYREYAQASMQMPYWERLQLHGMVEIILSYFVKHATPLCAMKDKRIALLMEYVQQHLGENITVKDMADVACLTKSHMIRLFRQTLGTTPLQYVLRKKVQYAQYLLLSTDLTGAEVAQRIGIDDASYFIRLFRKSIGFTPQEYRTKLIG